MFNDNLGEIKVNEETDGSANNKVSSKRNEVPFSPGKPRDKFKVSIKFITKGSETQESIIGYYDTKMEALEAYDQAGRG